MQDEKHQDWRVGTLIINIIGWLDIAFFSFCGIMAWQSGQMTALPVLIPLVLIGVSLLLCGGTIEFTASHIRTMTPFGSFQMAWSEMTSVENVSDTLLFIASDKKLSVPDPGIWSGKEKRQAFALMIEQLQIHKLLPIKRTHRLLPFSHNCRR
jgi:hypothetical protein